jgi:hypothetical protein
MMKKNGKIRFPSVLTKGKNEIKMLDAVYFRHKKP